MLFPLTTQTVSELREIAAAIRRGCTLCPRQDFGSAGIPGSSACVVIAALMGGYSWMLGFGLQSRPFRQRGHSVIPNLYAQLIFRNDRLRITRERQADVLDRLARAYESAMLGMITTPVAATVRAAEVAP